MPKCSICQEPYDNWGNNAMPVNSGRCCDDCNWSVVLPARLNRLYPAKGKEMAENIETVVRPLTKARKERKLETRKD